MNGIERWRILGGEEEGFEIYKYKLMSSSNPLARFVQLHSDLTECYGKTAPKAYEKMSKEDQLGLCSEIRDEMKQIIKSDSIKLRNLLPLRMKALQ